MARPRGSRTGGSPPLTVSEVVARLKISRRTFYQWRQIGKGPRCHKLPNGELRVNEHDFEEWFASLEDLV